MSLLQEVINTADASNEVEDVIKESLNYLLALAESRATIFEQAIEKDLDSGRTFDSLTVPVTRVLKKRTEYRAITAHTTTDVLDAVSSAIVDMVGNPSLELITSGIAGIASDILSTVIGVGAGQERAMTGYTVAPIFPAIVRFDFAFWARGVSSQAIRKHTESAITCVVYESAVNVFKLTLNEFLSIYSSVIAKAFPDGDNMVDKIAMISQAKELYMLISEATASRGDEVHDESELPDADVGGLPGVRQVQVTDNDMLGEAEAKLKTVEMQKDWAANEDDIALVLANSKTRMLEFKQQP
jgi:hypothetical protein